MPNSNAPMREPHMATDKTPDHKRIKRAEEGRDEWKIKALSRREENEKLKIELNEKRTRLTTICEQNKSLKKELEESKKSIEKIEKELELFKKKVFK
jgi:predicted RNase H-like nuclease (RuvC/YqgF family)